MRNLIFISILFFSFGLTAQKVTELHQRKGLPTPIKYADANNDSVLSFEETKIIFENYMLNAHRKLSNDLVEDIETTLIELINYLEEVDCKTLKDDMTSKYLIDLYYKNIFRNETDSAYKTELVSRPDTAVKTNSIIFPIADSVKSHVIKLLGSRIQLSGCLDVYYSYDTNKPSNESLIGASGAGRVFDRFHNRLMLNLIQTRFDYATNDFNAVIDLAYGLGGEVANYGNSGSAIIIKQAFVSFKTLKNFVLTAGNFGTHIGYEVIEPANNFNYSASYLFANGPFYHTGLKGEYSFNKAGVMFGVVSGWDKIQDDNSSKTMIAQAWCKPGPKTSIYLNWIRGNEIPSSISADSIHSYKELYDLVVSQKLFKRFNVAFNGAFGVYNLNGNQYTWGGAAAYIQCDINSVTSVGIRSEYFDDSQHVQYFGAAYHGHTLTFIFKPNDNISFKAEARYDSSSQPSYWKGKNNELYNTQTTFGIAITGKF